MIRILLIGKNGQIGWELGRSLAPLGEMVAVTREKLDVTDFNSIRKTIREVKPQVVINATAYTAVDKAETELDLAMRINGEAPGVMAEEAKQLGALLVHYSTDYVFDGTKQGDYTEEDRPSPLSVYGKTKLAGEQAIQASGAAHLILRTSWVYGSRGKNFMLTILRLAKERPELKIVADQIGAPTWSRMIAEATAQILARVFSPLSSHTTFHALQRIESRSTPVVHCSPLTGLNGIYHLTAGGETSWHGFAKGILERASCMSDHASPKLISISTSDYPLPALRPANSMMSNEKLRATFGIVMPQWDDALTLCMEDIAQ